MKKLVLLTLTFAFSYAMNAQIQTPAPSPFSKIDQKVGLTDITIEYSRPGVKGREIFGGLEAYDKIWRTGANESTVITFSEDVMFGGKEVKAGTYSLYTIPGENWTFILNSKLSWGTQYDESQDVVRVPAAVTTEGASSFERFTIYFDTLSDTKAHLNLQWGKTMTAIPITTK